jgi:hypothetical protein
LSILPFLIRRYSKNKKSAFLSREKPGFWSVYLIKTYRQALALVQNGVEQQFLARRLAEIETAMTTLNSS